jgi:redox-sensitive bicupin YhaK (pirin superfamily)
MQKTFAERHKFSNQQQLLKQVFGCARILFRFHLIDKPESIIMKQAATQQLRFEQAFDGFWVARADMNALQGLGSPLLMLDHFRMSQPVFGPHPHAGFSAVTLMFEDAETGFLNRDSQGYEGPIQPGDVHWTVAGRGILHDEPPLENGKIAHGLQLFVNLPAAKKWMAPQALHLRQEDIPVHHSGIGSKIRVLAGSFNGLTAPIALPEPARWLDALTQPGENLTLELPAGWNALFYVLTGEVQTQPHESSSDPTPVQALQLTAFGNPGAATEHLTLTTTSQTPAHWVWLSGIPTHEPLVQHGPFAMSTAADIKRVIQAYQAGDMGRLERLS